MINKEKTIVIVSGHLPSYREITLAGLTIEGWKSMGFDVCITSHSPIPSELQKASKYSIYTDENVKTEWPLDSGMFVTHRSNNFAYSSNFGNQISNYSIAILLNLKNALTMLKDKGYTNFIFGDNDALFDIEDGKLLLSHMEESNFEELDFFGYKEGHMMVVTSFFAGKISTFLNVLDKFNLDNTELAEKAYIDLCKKWSNFLPGFENFFSYLVAEDYFPKNKIYPHPMRHYFKNKWQGRQGGGQVDFPLFNPSSFGVTGEIVRIKNSELFCLMLRNRGKGEEEFEVKIYGDGKLIRQDKYVSSFTHSWVVLNSNYEHYRTELIYKDKNVFNYEISKEKIVNSISNVEFF